MYNFDLVEADEATRELVNCDNSPGSERGGQVLGQLPAGPEDGSGAGRQRLAHHSVPAEAGPKDLCGEVWLHRSTYQCRHGH